MIHNHVLTAAGMFDGSCWSVGISWPAPYLPSKWPGAVLVQVIGPEARQCRVALFEADATRLVEALCKAYSGDDQGWIGGGDALAGEASQWWEVRRVGDRTEVELRNHHGDVDTVSLAADDVIDMIAEVQGNLERMASSEMRAEVDAMSSVYSKVWLQEHGSCHSAVV